MENQSPDFKKAQEYAEVMLKAILSDCPDKKQATKDRIVFSVEKVV